MMDFDEIIKDGKLRAMREEPEFSIGVAMLGKLSEDQIKVFEEHREEIVEKVREDYRKKQVPREEWTGLKNIEGFDFLGREIHKLIETFKERFPYAAAYANAAEWAFSGNYLRSTIGMESLEKMLAGEDGVEVMEQAEKEFKYYYELFDRVVPYNDMETP